MKYYIKKKKYIVLALSFIALSLAMILFILTKVEKSRETIGKVDVNNMIKSHIQKMANSHLDNKTIEKETKRFVDQLEKEVNLLAKEKEVTLFISEAVLSGAIDYTPILQHRLNNFNSKIVKHNDTNK